MGSFCRSCFFCSSFGCAVAREERDQSSIGGPFVAVYSCFRASELFGLPAIGAHEPNLPLAILATVRKERQPTPIRRPAWRTPAFGGNRKESCGLTAVDGNDPNVIVT